MKNNTNDLIYYCDERRKCFAYMFFNIDIMAAGYNQS